MGILLTWNPKQYSWDGTTRKEDGSFFPSLAESIATIRHGQPARDRWSCGNTTRNIGGSRFFLLRQGVEPKGVVGAGRITSAPYQAQHWADASKSAWYVDIQFDGLVDAQEHGSLHVYDVAGVNWDSPSGGISIRTEVMDEVAERWRHFLRSSGANDFASADEMEPSKVYREGLRRQIWVNAFERDPDARAECVAHYGTVCQICSFDFGEAYGDIGVGFIHVHHINPLSESPSESEVDPVTDLLPVCPNCHAMLHRRRPVLSPEELRAKLAKRRPVKGGE